jgi:hypothetical protein
VRFERTTTYPKLEKLELESTIEIAEVRFRVINKEREDQIKQEVAARYIEFNDPIGDLNVEFNRYENKFYKLIAQTLVPDLGKFEKLFYEREILDQRST